MNRYSSSVVYATDSSVPARLTSVYLSSRWRTLSLCSLFTVKERLFGHSTRRQHVLNRNKTIHKLPIFEQWGLCKELFSPKILVYYGSVWVGPGLILNLFSFGKSSQNSSKPILIFWSSIQCVFCLCQVVSHYDLSVLSLSVMGFQKKFGWL